MATSSIAFTFPGQGSQSVGMLKELASDFPLVRQTFAEASEVLGLDLLDLAQNGPEVELNRTQNTQPAMLTAGVAIWRLWRSLSGPMPSVMAGHSLGEYTALVCGSALEFRDAVALVAERGRLMQEAIPEGQGAMAAVLGLENDRLREVCSEAAESQVVEAANFNSPGQVVIAGDKAAVERAMALAKSAGAKRVLPLPVSVPSHCALMKPAAKTLEQRLSETVVRAPEVPVLHNVAVAEALDPAEIRGLLARQLYSPVRWVETVRDFHRRGIRQIVEMGPGKVLTGLNRRIDKNLACFAVHDPESLQKTMESCANAGQ